MDTPVYLFKLKSKNTRELFMMGKKTTRIITKMIGLAQCKTWDEESFFN